MNDVIRSSNANDDTWENNAKYLLERCPHTVRVREGGGPENLMHSFIHTFMAMEQKLRGSHETRAVVPETLVVWVAVDYWRCLCKPPGDINHGNSYQCRDCCTIRPEKAPAQKADPQHGAKARDFVEYDSAGGVRIDMARYLRSPAGQAQLALGGKKASERQPCSHGNATGHCQHCLDAL